MKSFALPLVAALLCTSATTAFGQITTIAHESFDYTWPGLLDTQNGGTGWSAPWALTPNVDDIVIQANPPTNGSNPYPWSDADDIGHFAQQALEFGFASRYVDVAPHADVTEGGKFGKDNTTIWVSVTMWNFQQFGVHFGSVSFCDTDYEHWLMGSPGASYGWGIDACPGIGCISNVPGSDDTQSARLVTRIDYLPGQDRVRMWVNPAEKHPTTLPGLDTYIDDMPWNQIRIWSGGNASLYYWDNLVIEKGTPIPISSFCFGDGSGTQCPCGNNGNTGEGCGNSTFNGGAKLDATGTTSVATDDLTFTSTNLIPSQGALLFVGNNAINNGNGIIFGDGLRCAGGSVIRLGVKMPDGTGTATWGPGLTSKDAWDAGDVKRFQVWYRDPIGVPCGTQFNLTNGIEVGFTI